MTTFCSHLKLRDALDKRNTKIKEKYGIILANSTDIDLSK